MDKVLAMIKMTDEEFFDQYLADTSLEELAEFLNQFPEFMDVKIPAEMDETLFEKIKAEIHQREKQA